MVRAYTAGMVGYLIRRLWQMVPTLFGVVLLVFVLFRFYGGDPAEIKIDLRLEGDLAVLDVSDNGGGIADDEVPLIFGRFYRAGDEMTRTSQGTGLGLYLVQRIMKSHHGTVSVAATGPDGTTMRVTLTGTGAGEDRE